MPLRRIRLFHALLLVLILIVGAYVRFSTLGAKSLWTDEYLSLECSSGWARTDDSLAGRAMVAPDLVTLKNARPFSSIWSSIARDENHPPLYFMLLRLWRELLGDSPAAIRSLSAVASLLAILLVFAIGVQVHSLRAGLWACLLMAVAGPQIEQAQDARAYMLVTAASLGAALAMIRIDRFGVSGLRCAVLFIMALIAPLLHYMAMASVGAIWIYAMLLMRGERRKWTLATLGAAAAVYVLLWGVPLVQQHYRMIDDTAWMVDAKAGHPLRDLCSLPARLFLTPDDQQNPWIVLGGGVLVVPLLLCRRHPELRLWCIWLIVPVAVALLIDIECHRRSLSMIKYTLAAAPAVYLMAGLLAAHLRRVGWIPSALLAACCAITIPCDCSSPLPDYRELSRFIARSSGPDDPVIFVFAHPGIYCSEQLLSASYYLASQNHPLYMMDRAPSADLLAQLKQARHLCVIADSIEALDRRLIPGLTIDRAEMLAGIAVVGTADPQDQARKMSKAKFNTDPQLKLALGMR